MRPHREGGGSRAYLLLAVERFLCYCSLHMWDVKGEGNTILIGMRSSEAGGEGGSIHVGDL